MKKINIKAPILLLLVLTMLLCSSVAVYAATMPSCTSLKVSSITTNSARVDFKIKNPSKLSIKYCGMQIRKKGGSWSTKNETIAKSNRKLATIPVWYTVGKNKEFSYTLSPDTVYEYRGFCKYNDKTYYTGIGNFRTKAVETYDTKVSAFIKDDRWKSGISWTKTQKPKISGYSSTGCCAYCADFTKYVYGRTGFGNSTFTNVSEIKNGDVLKIKNSTWGTHYIVVLYRSGNSLYTAEGNSSGKVHVSKYKRYSISGEKIYSSYIDGYYKLKQGYHK